MSKGVSTKRRFILTARELETLTSANREIPTGRRVTKDTLIEFWVRTGTAQNEEWAPEDLRVLELVS